uniref:Uncharacterized protein n=1 Tax=Acrobeloides nanus TaxID=290746 RepID=A0A914D575_9BILA
MCDGSFKFAPKSVKQVYRIFGVAKGGFSCPLVTALVNGMSEQLYTEMWMAAKQKLLEDLACNPLGDEYREIVWKNLGRVGRLMGYDAKELADIRPYDLPRPLPELDDYIDDDAQDTEDDNLSYEQDSEESEIGTSDSVRHFSYTTDEAMPLEPNDENEALAQDISNSFDTIASRNSFRRRNSLNSRFFIKKF